MRLCHLPLNCGVNSFVEECVTCIFVRRHLLDDKPERFTFLDKLGLVVYA